MSDGRLVAQAVASAGAISECNSPTLVDAVVATLRGRWLLVLDNCEHVLEGCATLVEMLLAQCPQLSILATSKQPLGGLGERVWRVPPLTTPASPGATL